MNLSYNPEHAMSFIGLLRDQIVKTSWGHGDDFKKHGPVAVHSALVSMFVRSARALELPEALVVAIRECLSRSRLAYSAEWDAHPEWSVRDTFAAFADVAIRVERARAGGSS